MMEKRKGFRVRTWAMTKMQVEVLSLCILLTLTHVTATRHNRDPNKRRRLRDDIAASGACNLEVRCDSALVDEDGLAAVRLPIRGPRGKPGEDGEKGEKGEPGLPGVPGRAGKSYPPPPKVAFFVGLEENMGPQEKDTDVVFDNVVTNVGDGYNPKTGRFRAPYNGTYQFHIVISAQGRQKAAVMLIKNGVMILTVWAESIPFWSTASNTAILKLKEKDQVWLMALGRAPYLHGYMYTTFSGHLLFTN
ncbi:C1q-related factor isoform X2 [Lingula anatina]|uniref:C1q-related factor isoform X2 n=1 Tax=Lingula anatina TaxID=7574 RepID=A0A1S3INR5_LINAN|nr:C1q-related factor isoform X2 [Lingula anatina]|eukprot:XP_013399541.1 C1q-related factor isoform X2 [Lingula anatina]